MSDYLLLTDISHCPKCYRKSAPKQLPALCRHCGMHLFKATDNLAAFEADTGWREYWVWTGQAKGWMHSTQLPAPQAQSREVVLEKLPDNYGTQEYINEKIDNSRIELKEALKSRKRGPTVTVAKLP